MISLIDFSNSCRSFEIFNDWPFKRFNYKISSRQRNFQSIFSVGLLVPDVHFEKIISNDISNKPCIDSECAKEILGNAM